METFWKPPRKRWPFRTAVCRCPAPPRASVVCQKKKFEKDESVLRSKREIIHILSCDGRGCPS
jgi:hypothetical protein